MSNDKRKGSKPIPDDVHSYLNIAQQAELNKIEGFGWELTYVRRTLFQDPVIVVINPEGSSIGVLEEDGRLNLDPNIKTRE